MPDADNAIAEATWKLGASRYPDEDSYWTLLIKLYSQDSRLDAVIDTLRRWTKVKEAPHKLMMLARAEQQRGDDSAAEADWRRAFELAPYSFCANIGMAMTLLRHAKDKSDYDQVEAMLTTAGEAWVRLVQDRRRRRELGVAQAAYFALSGKLDDARATLNTLLSYDADDKLALEISAAIGPK